MLLPVDPSLTSSEHKLLPCGFPFLYLLRHTSSCCAQLAASPLRWLADLDRALHPHVQLVLRLASPRLTASQRHRQTQALELVLPVRRAAPVVICHFHAKLSAKCHSLLPDRLPPKRCQECICAPRSTERQ